MEHHQQQKRKLKTELPEDIIKDEILTRLPVKSLLRFKCVCKPWLSLFSGSDFVKAHLSRQHHSNDQHYLVGMNYGFVFQLKIISGIKETRVDAIPFIKNGHFIGSINGLICVALREVFTLWNPAIRQYKEISVTSRIPLHTRKCIKETGNTARYRTCKHLFGFGWDPIENDYKVVIVCSESLHLKRGAVYSCKSNSWTELVIPSSMLGIRSRSFMNTRCPTTIVNECPYWSYSKCFTLSGKSYKRAYTAVFKFVAAKNEFRFLPDFDSSTIGRKELRLINLKDCLAGVDYTRGDYKSNRSPKRCVNVYSLDHEGSGGVWSKMYTVEPIDFGIPTWEWSKINYVLQNLEKLLCYDPETKEIKDVVDSAAIRFECFNYTPSLVFIRGMKSIVHSDT